jgi:hypothetical protein
MFMLRAQSVHLFHRTTNMSLTAPDLQLRSVITSSRTWHFARRDKLRSIQRERKTTNADFTKE